MTFIVIYTGAKHYYDSKCEQFIMFISQILCPLRKREIRKFDSQA